MQIEQHEELLRKADQNHPVINRRRVEPAVDAELFQKEKSQHCADYREQILTEDDAVVLDFGNHYVGNVTLQFASVGSHQDAPAWVKLRFAERPEELEENLDAYHGWISKGWIQQEELHLDVLPAEVSTTRRYAFRYLKIEVLAVSQKFRLMIPQVFCTEQTSAGKMMPYQNADPLLTKMDAVACRTLRSCMQDVFEDGPKRDRRLWMGDLWLQAKTNYLTYQKNDLVKRCLYLFAGSTLPGGRVGACVFTQSEVEVDDTQMFDYSLFYLPTLLDYVQETDDQEALHDLWPTALRQIQISQEQFDSAGLVQEGYPAEWCFVDWKQGLSKQASAQGIYLYCLQAGIRLAEMLGETETAQRLCADYEQKWKAARELLWDKEQKLFVSGKDRQISLASQVWMILGGAATPEEGSEILDCVGKHPEALGMVTPYAYHQYVAALLTVGQKEKALQVLKEYWGGMVRAGADTFWELYDPENPNETPYGGTAVNSYCHAWSCAPAYFLRKYF